LSDRGIGTTRQLVIIALFGIRLDVDHASVLVLGYSEASMLLKRPDSAKVRAIIAIHGLREYPVAVHDVTHSLILQFDDTEAPSSSDPIHAARIRFRQRRAADDGLVVVPPSVEHARRIIDFALAIREIDGMLLCQCQGGVSRSPAAALLCLATWTSPGRERDCVAQLFDTRPSAVPHRDLVRFGDELLHRNGDLLQALDHVRPP